VTLIEKPWRKGGAELRGVHEGFAMAWEVTRGQVEPVAVAKPGAAIVNPWAKSKR
jgi:hypothetical protein